MSTDQRLSLCLLGQPKILWAGQTLPIKRKLARVLLYYLGSQPAMISRSDLLLLFWPDMPNARQYLRDLLSKLKANLPDPDVIITDRDWLGLDYKKVVSDVITFEELYEQLTLPFINLEGRAMPETIYKNTLDAVNLWKSPWFLDGISVYDYHDLVEWIDQKNHTLRKKWITLMMRIVHHSIIIGDLESALLWLDKVIANDQYFEFPQAIYYRLQTLFRLGRFSEAYEFGKSYSDYLKAGWFEDYQLPFETLLKQIETEQPQVHPRTLPSMQLDDNLNLPFFFGENLLTQIQHGCMRGDVIVLSGETGMGKTRLLHEYIQRFARNKTILSMEGHYGEENLAFHPVVEMLRREMTPRDWEKIGDHWKIQLAPLMPELQSLTLMPFSEKTPVEDHQIALLEAFRQVFLTFTGKLKIIFKIENAQWLDHETVQLLKYLTHRRFFRNHAHLFLLIASDKARNPLQDFLQIPDWQHQLVRIEMPKLDDAKIADLVLHLLKQPITKERAAHLQRETGGNPFFLIEILRTLLENPDQKDYVNFDQALISNKIQLIIRERLMHLSEDARLTLNCAALIGVEFSFDYLLAMTGLKEAQLAEGLDELIDKNIIQIISHYHDPLRYKFNQTILKRMVLEGISKTKTRVLHKRLATHLLNQQTVQGSADELADIGLHLGRAGKTQQAFQYCISAAEMFKLSDKNQKAHAAYQQAYLLTQSSKFQISDQQLFDLWVGWGDLATRMNELKSASEYYHHAIEEGFMRKSALLIGSGMSGEGFLQVLQSKPNQGLQFLNRAAHYLQDSSTIEYIQNVIRKMMTYIYLFDLETGINEYEQALKIDHPELKTDKGKLIISSLQNAAALTFVLAGKYQEAETTANQSTETALVFQNPSIRIENEFTLGLCFYYQGKYKKALQHLNMAIHIAENQYYWHFILESLAITSRVHLMLGNSFQCMADIQNLNKLEKIHPHEPIRSVLLHNEGRFYLAFGEFQKAESFFAQAIKSGLNQRDTILNQTWIALAYCLQGEHEKGIQLLEALKSNPELKRYPIQQLEIQSRLGLAHYLKGDIDTALRILSPVGDAAGSLNLAGAGSAYHYVLGMKAVKENIFENAKSAAEFIQTKATLEENPWLDWLAIEIMIAWKIANGNTDSPYHKQKKTLLKKLMRAKPQNLENLLDPSQPPLFALV